MAEIYRFLKLAESYIYILVGIIGFIYIRKLIIAINEYRNCLFGLEKDNARSHIFQAGGIILLSIIVVVGEFSFLSYVDTNPNVFNVLATPTINLSATETPMITQSPQTPVASSDSTNIVAAQIPAGESVCVPGKIEWNYPLDGNEIKGKVELKATVNVTDFGFYKYENSQDNVNWNTMQAGKTIVTNGVIGIWDTTLQPPGDYYLRLVVYNNNQTALTPCVIKIHIIPE